MGQNWHKKTILLSIVLCLFIGLILSVPWSQRAPNLPVNLKDSSYSSSQSSDPNHPHSLYDDSSVYDYYNASSYYYRTENASPSYYQVIWLQPQDIQNNFDLYLYSDSNYSNLKVSSFRGAGLLDWVVFHPNITQDLYLKVSTLSSSNGFAFIEWEDSSNYLSVGSSISNNLNSPDSLEIYQISLLNTSTYRFKLEVPSEGDFDLYLYQLNPGMGANYNGYSARSKTLGNGFIEFISNYTPAKSGDYAIIVVRSSGSGTFTLSVTTFPSAPAILADDLSLNEHYNASATYYYRTENATPSYYQVIWLQPQDKQHNFNLYLYSDSKYSNLKGSSLRGAGLLDWVVFRPNIPQYFYAEVYALPGSSGNASIEWVDSSQGLYLGTPVSAPLSSAECIEIYQVYLTTSTKYRFSLEVPDGGDYDLYLYYLNPGATTNNAGYSRRSINSGNGSDELIYNFYPTSSGYYALIVDRVNGTGIYTLSMSSIQTLHNDLAAYGYYDASTSYYYQTDYASSTHYHVIWVQPAVVFDTINFNLFLYSDENYSQFMASSFGELGPSEWIIFRPSISQIFYPTVVTYFGNEMFAYIEWESSSDLSYSGVSGVLNASECVDIYETYLLRESKWKFTLEVPNEGDFDLYIYHLNSGEVTGYSGYVSSSRTVGNGIDEVISNFEPTYNGDYAVFVVRSSGSGNYTLTYEFSIPNPFPGIYLDYILLLAGLGITGLIIALSVMIRKRRRRRESSPYRNLSQRR